jgi:2-aminoadipate transaminase
MRAQLMPVTPHLAIHAPPAPYALAEWTRGLRPSTIGAMLGAMGRPGVISFALGLPAPELFPTEEYARAAARVLAADTGSLQYRPAYPPLKEHVVRLMASRGVSCTPSQVFLTTGAQQGLALIARLLLETGGTVIAERRVYMGFSQVLEAFRPRILSVDTDLRTGMDVDAVERMLIAGERPAFIYCITDGHNPLGVSLSPAKRAKLAGLARRYAIPVIEDDAYGLLNLGDAVLPMRAAEDRWVLYVGSFSKTLAPGFRVGWVVAPEELVPVLGSAKDGSDIDTATFAQRIIASYLDTGAFPEHLRTARATYRERRDVMIAALGRHFPDGTRWSVPGSGALLWVELPERFDADEVLRVSLEREGVAFVPGAAFDVHGGASGRNCMRLNYSFPQPSAIDDGIERLGRVLRGMGG